MHTHRMTTPLARAAAVLCLVLAMGSGLAHAGRTCEAKPMTVESLRQGLDLAQRTAQALEAQYQQHGSKVVLLARAGQDLSKYDLQYSHFGWAYRTPEGQWRVAHKLNTCGTADGWVYRQGLGEFFLDDLWRPVAAVQVPTPAVQQALWSYLTQPQTVLRMQHQPYSMVSYAWGQKYQQSNQWAIESLAAAMEPATVQQRSQAQAWLKFKGYEPSTLTIRSWTRLGGRMSAANIAFDDHPNDQRFTSRIQTVTVDSVTQWLQRAQLAGALRVVQ